MDTLTILYNNLKQTYLGSDTTTELLYPLRCPTEGKKEKKERSLTIHDF